MMRLACKLYSPCGKPAAARTLCLLLCACVLFFTFYLALEAGHECPGEGCPACVWVQRCETLLRHLAAGVAALVLCLLGTAVCLLWAAPAQPEPVQRTPVSHKVRLND